MTAPTLEPAVRALVERFVEDLVALVRAAAPAASEAGPPRTKPRRRRGRRTATALRRLADAVLGVLARTSDQSVSEIAAAVGSTPRDVVRPLAVLLAEGRITKRGERKGTRYSVAPARAVRTAVKPKVRERSRPKRKRR